MSVNATEVSKPAPKKKHMVTYNFSEDKHKISPASDITEEERSYIKNLIGKDNQKENGESDSISRNNSDWQFPMGHSLDNLNSEEFECYVAISRNFKVSKKAKKSTYLPLL